jgi:hypothetical protein
MAIDIHQVVIVYQLKAMPISTRERKILIVYLIRLYLFVTGVQIRHEITQPQPIIIDARLGVRFDRYVNGRVMDKYRSKHMRRRLATDALDMV